MDNSNSEKTPEQKKEVVYPYDPEVLQDAQEMLEAKRRHFYAERTRAFVETLTPEQQKEHDAFKDAIQRQKSVLGIETNATMKWSKPDTPKRWGKIFGLSSRTFIRRVKNGEIRAKKLSDRRYQVDVRDIPEVD